MFLGRYADGWGSLRRLLWATTVLLLSSHAFGQFQAPLYLGSKDGILDEAGRFLPGTDPASEEFGWSCEKGALVQVLLANGAILPPQADGTPHSTNTLLHVTRIGRGVVPCLSTRGAFGASLVPRPPGAIFVRVFNGPSLAESTHYGDSQTFVPNGNAVFRAEIGSTSVNFANDADDDGLNDVWEGYLGSDLHKADTDGDGVEDQQEYRAGTGLADGSSYLEVASMKRLSAGSWQVAWPSVPGLAYRAQFATGNLSQGLSFSDVGSVVFATGLVSSAEVMLPGDAPAHLRVRVVE